MYGHTKSCPLIRGLSNTLGEAAIGLFRGCYLYTGSRHTMSKLLGIVVERIEVVKGPQCALYGRISFDRAINRISDAASGLAKM